MFWLLFFTVGFALMAYYGFMVLIQPGTWLLAFWGVALYFGGWWVGVPTIIATMAVIGMWES